MVYPWLPCATWEASEDAIILVGCGFIARCAPKREKVVTRSIPGVPVSKEPARLISKWVPRQFKLSWESGRGRETSALCYARGERTLKISWHTNVRTRNMPTKVYCWKRAGESEKEVVRGVRERIGKGENPPEWKNGFEQVGKKASRGRISKENCEELVERREALRNSGRGNWEIRWGTGKARKGSN